LKQLTDALLDELAAKARQSPRLRANHNLHEDLADPIQRLAIAMEPGTLIVPHRHSQTWELLLPLRGRFVVLIFDDAGKVLERALLGQGCKAIEMPANTWHAVLSLDQGGVIFEVKQGPYRPIVEADVAAWSKGLDAEMLNGWYADAGVGDSYRSM
jgi:cupin fold WbuC family metalloprotein